MHSDRHWQQLSPSHGCPASLPSSPRTATAGAINLPPSIPISLDGEEGAYAYSQHLLQCNTDIKLECYQPPPNRTIDSSITDYEDLTSVGNKRSAVHKGALPLLPYQSSDYVSSSLLSSWRSASSDRTMTRGIDVPLPSSSIAGSRQQQRSSSADSVRKLVKRFFVRKLGSRVPATTKATETLDATRNVFSNFDDISSCGSVKGNLKGVGDSRWDLPPNYVDMIFTKDPLTNENISDVVEKDFKSD